jgi:hypothetical protein
MISLHSPASSQDWPDLEMKNRWVGLRLGKEAVCAARILGVHSSNCPADLYFGGKNELHFE